MTTFPYRIDTPADLTGIWTGNTTDHTWARCLEMALWCDDRGLTFQEDFDTPDDCFYAFRTEQDAKDFQARFG